MMATSLNSAGGIRTDVYVWIAAAGAIIAFGGFAPTYWLQLAPMTFIGPPLFHLHAALFSAWTLLFLTQTLLVANGRTAQHRAMGVVGVAMASAMIVVGAAAAIYSLNTQIAAGYGDRARAFAFVPFSALAIFAAYLSVALANVARPEIHKRVMVLANISLLQAAMARVFFIALGGGGPGHRPGLGAPIPVIATVGPGAVVDLLIVAAMIYDWRTRGRPHRAYVIGGGLLLAAQILRAPLAMTPAWLSTADYLAAFAR